MGRQAYFSTGLEYKFAFAVQESSDMRDFGGQNRNQHYGDAMIVWNAKLDRDQALDVVMRSLECKKEDLAWIEDVPLNVDGTRTILPDRIQCADRSIQAFAYLGLLIQHQLGYDPNLHCTQEDQDQD